MIKGVLEFLYHFFTDRHLKLCCCRGILCAAGAIFLWARPAASLVLWSCLLPLTSSVAVLMLQRKVPQRMKHFLWLLPAGASCLLFRTFPDAAAFWALSLLPFITAGNRIFSGTLPERLTAVTAIAAGFLLICKSFTADWFAFIPATLLLLTGCACVELSAVFRNRC